MKIFSRRIGSKNFVEVKKISMRKICSEAQNCLKTNTIDGCRPIAIRLRFVSRLVLHRVKKYLLYFYVGFFLLFHLYIIIIIIVIWKEKAKATSNIVVLSLSLPLSLCLFSLSPAHFFAHFTNVLKFGRRVQIFHIDQIEIIDSFFSSSSSSSLTHHHHRRVLVHFSIS